MSDTIQQMILHFSAKITEKQDEIIMQTIQEIGGETFREITLDKHKVLEALRDYVNKQKGAEVEEVKHGEWILKSEIRRFFEEVDEDFYVECPFCKRAIYVPFEFETDKMLEFARKKYPYCNCGAKMDGGVKA